MPPVYISSYLIGQFSFDLSRLEQAIVSDIRPDIALYRKKTLHSGKHAVRNAVKNAMDRTEVFRLMGLCDWLLGRKKERPDGGTTASERENGSHAGSSPHGLIWRWVNGSSKKEAGFMNSTA